MKAVDTFALFTLTFGRKLSLLCATVALAGLGCAGSADTDRNEEGAGTVTQPGALADEAAPGTGLAVASSCDDPWGAPIPVSQEGAFYACFYGCLDNGGSHVACQFDCCSAFTGCDRCYQQ